ncbi:MAG: hypothetical protein IPP17_16045 [Bacteroidetes bacterium]|nr:hypothetical protein [Bacteroidota bacterium]
MKSLLTGIFVGLLLCTRGWAMPAGQFEFFADSLTGNQGSQVIVPIRVNHFDSIISVQGTIAFDSAVLAFVGVQNMNLPSMTNANFGTSYVVNGKLTFSWNENNLTPISIPDGSEIFGVVFQLVGSPGSESPVAITAIPTLIEVVNWAYTPIPFATRSGNVRINVPTVCEIPDSLNATGVLQTQAHLQWHSTNPGANYFLEWGIWGFTPGSGLGNASGTSQQGNNTVLVSNLQAGGTFEFYVQEECDSLNTVSAGPFGFATLATAAAVTIFGDSIEGPSGVMDTIYIRVLGFQDIISAQGTLSWDAGVATYGAVIPLLPNMSLSNFGLTAVAQGIVTFSWNDPSLIGVNLADSAAMFGLQVLYVGAAGAASDVDFVQSPTPWEVVDVSFNTAQLTLLQGHLLVTGSGTGIATDPSFAEVQIYPNPVSADRGRFTVFSGSGFPTVQHVSWMNGLGQSFPLDWICTGNMIECQIPSETASGFGFLNVETDAGHFLRKIVFDRP